MKPTTTVKWNCIFYGLGDYRNAEPNGTDTIILTTIDGMQESVVFQTETDYRIAVMQLETLTEKHYEHVDQSIPPRDTGERLY